MAAVNMRFDPIRYIQDARKIGFTQEQAEFNAQELERFSEIIQDQKAELEHLKSKDHSTKGDVRESELRLQKEIREVELSLQKEISNVKTQTLLWMGVNSAFLLGVMARGFHWW